MSDSLVVYLIIVNCNLYCLISLCYQQFMYGNAMKSKLAILEEKKEELYNLPVNDEVEAVKNMHLIWTKPGDLSVNGSKMG